MSRRSKQMDVKEKKKLERRMKYLEHLTTLQLLSNDMLAVCLPFFYALSIAFF
jgi:hypothetical protein